MIYGVGLRALKTEQVWRTPMPLRKILATGSLLAVCAFAQTAPNATSPSAAADTAQINQLNANNVCRIYFTAPKPGMASQYETGRKKHNAFHAAQKDTWTWNTWLIDTGDNAGNYVTTSCGHSWKDFDDWEAKMGKADTADGAVNMAPSSGGGRNGFYVYRADMSLAPANRPVAPMAQVTVYMLHPGMAPDFAAAIRKVNEALSKADWPKVSGWLQLVNGGNAPTFVLIVDRKNWSEFAPPNKSVADVLNATYGKEQADAIQKSIRDCTAHLYTEAAAYRPDLSYMPKQ
jgi:hypothetical protein